MHLPTDLRWIHSDLFELLRAVLEVAAVVLGVIAYFDLRRQIEVADGLATKLRNISRTLSTRFLGYFPSNFRKINNLLEQTKKSIRIMVDYPDYGSLTAHEDFLEYGKLIGKLAAKEGIEVYMVCYSLQESKKRLDLEFGTTDKLRGYASEEVFKSLFHRKKCKGTPNPETVMSWLIDDQELTEKTFKQAGVSLRVRESDLPLFCWIRDDDAEAVFSFPFNENPKEEPPNLEPLRGSEIAFFTREEQLVKTLSRLFDDIYSVSESLSSDPPLRPS